MTETNWRELCEELIGTLAELPFGTCEELLVRAKAALAQSEPDGPAVPEGREPAAVVGELSDEELAQAAKAAIHDYKYPTELVYFLDSYSREYEPFLLALRAAIAADRARRPAPVAEGEVAKLVEWLRDDLELYPAEKRRVADLLERQAAPVPVPVSERLPEPSDCDAEGRCWAWDWLAEKWCLCDRTNACRGFGYWLPAYALPLPQEEATND